MDPMSLSSTIASAYSGEQQAQKARLSLTELYRPFLSSDPTTPTQSTGTMTSTSTGVPMAVETQKVLDISNLISPPDHVYDSFSSTAVARIKVPAALKKPESTLPSAPMISPPISPDEKPKDQISPSLTSSVPVKDPILYPPTDASPSPSRPVPLFAADEKTVFHSAVTHDADREVDRIIDGHILAVGPSSDGERPAREDYRMALHFKSDVMKRFQDDQFGWLKREKALLASDRAYRARALPIHARPVAKPQPKPIRSNVNRVQKPVKAKEARVTKQQPRPIRTNAGPIRSTIRVSSTPEPRHRTVAPNREDKDFTSLPDYCPPLDSLPNKPNSLNTEWKGKPLDLSKDPYAHLLHPEEVKLAAALRLDCATYLTSKRRIFERRLYCAQIGKEFRKTDAQQACKIDVNKASKLWSAYDSVRWLDIQWMSRFL